METSHLKPTFRQPLPLPVKTIVCSFLKVSELPKIFLCNKSWNGVSTENFWKGLAVKQLGNPFSTFLANNRQHHPNPWKKVVCDFLSPFSIKSDALTIAIPHVGMVFEEHEFLRSVNIAIFKNNVNDLDAALNELKTKNRLHLLNGINSTLSSAVYRGADVKIIALLIKFGAKEVVDIGHWQTNSLNTATLEGNVTLTQCLLENGARADLTFGLNEDEFKRITKHPKLEKAEVIECFLLIMKAWTATQGKQAVAENPHALRVLELAILEHKFIFAKMLVAFGINLNQERFLKVIPTLIFLNDLEALKFVHENSLFDLVNFRDEQNRTLLFPMSIPPQDKTIDFLIQIGIPTDVKDKEGLDYKQVIEKNRKEFS